MEKLIDEQNLKRDRHSRIIVVALGFLVAVILIVRVAIANRLVEASARLGTLDTEIAHYQGDNRVLAEEVRVQGSLVEVLAEAREIGFIANKSLFYLTVPRNVAMGSEALSRF